MPNTQGIVWLSSYPKSGNTWFRIVLSYLLNRSSNLSYINNIDEILGSPIAASRIWMNQCLGFDSTFLTDDEVDQLRPEVYRWYAHQLQQTTYIKIHDAYTQLPDNRPLIPNEGCLGAVYFIRNPLDVAISLAHHAKCPIDWSIHMMGNKDFCIPFAANKEKQVRQQLLSWSQHVQSWVSIPSINVLVLRYEDMLAQPFATFSKAMNFLNLNVDDQHLEQAIMETSFNKLQQFEQRFGFKEKPNIEGQFFRKGIVGDWKNTLSDDQVQRIINDHQEMMHAYGYLD